MSGCGLRTSRPCAPSTLPLLGLWWAQDLTPGSNLTPHLHPSVHPLQQAHPSKLDWGKAGGRVSYTQLDGGYSNPLRL